MARRRQDDGGLSGVIVVDKPPGLTSHDVVSRVRKKLDMRRVGHAGTLDPMATGVLVVMLGQATKLAPFLSSDDKSYAATVSFGAATDTLDAEGEVVARSALPTWWQSPSCRAHIEAALECERQRLAQLPPHFSAIKIDGRAAHRRVRSGETVVLKERAVAVHHLELVGLNTESAQVDVTMQVSKGYYVRAFARDLGETLSIPAHLSKLRRTNSGPFDLSQAVPIEAVDADSVMPLAHAARAALGTATLTADGVRRARLGQTLGQTDFAEPQVAPRAAWLDAAGDLIAIGSRKDNDFIVIRGFSPPTN